MPLLDWIAGGWYLAVRCRNCDVEFAFLRDAEIEEIDYLTDAGRLVITCPGCYIPMDYSAEQIRRIQAM